MIECKVRLLIEVSVPSQGRVVLSRRERVMALEPDGKGLLGKCDSPAFPARFPARKNGKVTMWRNCDDA